MSPISAGALALLASLLLGTVVSSCGAEAISPPPIKLHVDATDVARGIFRVSENIRVARAGRIVLLYPKWLPGYHAPAGPIEKLGGLVVSAGGKQLSWRRDAADVYAFEVDVPRGARSIDLQFQYLSAVAPQQGRIVMTPEMLALEWHTVVLYPQGIAATDIGVAASVKLPAGWQFATSLQQTGSAEGSAAFEAVTLRDLIDSPLYAGRHFARFALDHGRSAVHLNVPLADRPAQMAMTADKLRAHRALVEQADKLFGTRPFDHYDFILALSDRLGGYGLEHRRSSENAVSARYLLDWEQSVDAERTLLPHEYIHSWNGKFRYAAGLDTRHYHEPVADTMLWVYEGLTEYWGYVLAARTLRSALHAANLGQSRPARSDGGTPRRAHLAVASRYDVRSHHRTQCAFAVAKLAARRRLLAVARHRFEDPGIVQWQTFPR